MRLLLTVQYLGTRYAGWQAQTNALAIQSVIEEVLAKMYGTEIRLEGAGRTDSGVHAIAQRAHYDAPSAIPLRGLVRGMNDLLPHDIRISAAEEIADDFHCRFRAKAKTYVYRIWNAEVMNVFEWETSAHVAQPLDPALMHEAAQALVGTHDFKAFTVLAPEVSSTTRTIHECSVHSAQCSVQIRVTADGFLRFMVRRIAGSLIEIGRGKIGPESIRLALEPTFEEARWTAPAKGLVLEQIQY
ncbi:MAG TPA: tRNA pseudouridine(38-40) synthase TruA [Thermoanaerobaculia bacterium]|nr:tRNA pseudouridine(38-40) synthase TruA [Thermoanaerobaculia bacterium]